MRLLQQAHNRRCRAGAGPASAEARDDLRQPGFHSVAPRLVAEKLERGAGDVFGELCLSGLGGRLETATAMEDSFLKEIPCGKFLDRLAKDSLLEGFIKYMAVRVADQQQVIANLVTVDSEQRLGKTLLQIARKLGKKDPRSIRIEVKLSHEELAAMVGTTRPRISVFMQRFRNLGLIEYNTDHHLIIKEKKLTAYLASIL